MTRSQLASFAGIVLALIATCTAPGLVATVNGQASSGRIVDCRIESPGVPVIAGKCRFKADRDGSFSLENVDVRRSLSGPILLVTVSVTAPGIAEVRGLTRDGINSRWGEARRIRQDRGCWQGSDFKICAW